MSTLPCALEPDQLTKYICYWCPIKLDTECCPGAAVSHPDPCLAWRHLFLQVLGGLGGAKVTGFGGQAYSGTGQLWGGGVIHAWSPWGQGRILLKGPLSSEPQNSHRSAEDFLTVQPLSLPKSVSLLIPVIFLHANCLLSQGTWSKTLYFISLCRDQLQNQQFILVMLLFLHSIQLNFHQFLIFSCL